jgi:hypothetical protein
MPLIVLVIAELEVMPYRAINVAMRRDSFFPIALTILPRAILKVLAYLNEHSRYIPFVVNAETPNRKVQIFDIV